MPNTGHYALLIGVKDYLDTKKHGLGNLGSPANDITSLHEWLTDPAFGDVPEGNCIVLHSDPSFSPHHDEINAAIELDRTIGVKRNVSQTPSIYVTSHGKTEALPGGGVDYKLLRNYLDYLLRQ